MLLTDFAIHSSGKYTKPEHLQIILANDEFHDIFLTSLGRNYHTPKTGKIVLRFIEPSIEELGGFTIRKKVAVELLDIVEYWQDFDFNAFEKMAPIDQKKYYWKLICDSVIDIAQQLKWETEPLLNIYKNGLQQLTKNN